MCTMLFSMGQLTLRLTVFANAINSQSKQVQHREYCALRMKISVRDNKGPKIKFPPAREFICPISFSHADWRGIKTPKKFQPAQRISRSLARSLAYFSLCASRNALSPSRIKRFCRCLSPIIIRRLFAVSKFRGWQSAGDKNARIANAHYVVHACAHASAYHACESVIRWHLRCFVRSIKYLPIL